MNGELKTIVLWNYTHVQPFDYYVKSLETKVEKGRKSKEISEIWTSVDHNVVMLPIEPNMLEIHIRIGKNFFYKVEVLKTLREEAKIEKNNCNIQ